MFSDVCLAINFCVFVLIALGIVNRRLIFIGAIIDSVFIFYLIKFYSRVYFYLNHTHLFLNILLSLLFSITILFAYFNFFNDFIKDESLLCRALIELKRKVSSIKPLQLLTKIIGYIPLLILSISLLIGLQSLLSGLLTKINLGIFKFISLYSVIIIVILLNYVFSLYKRDKQLLRSLVKKAFEMEDIN